MKKITSLVLAVLLAISVSGCSGAVSNAPANQSYPATSMAAGENMSPQNGYVSPEREGDDDWRYEEIQPEEEYDNSPETPFKDVVTSPLSTFSSDVDTASYSNMRRFISQGVEPEGVRIEELVNYFDYSYPRPAADAEDPFSITTEIGACPWNNQHQLAMVGIQGAELEIDNIESNIVFLLDVSGSMDEKNKLPLLQDSFKLLLNSLDEKDVVSIVTYAGNDQIIADSVSGSEHKKLKRMIDGLYAAGSTAGANGLLSAYELAEENYIEGGNNRIILATDGDFNVGPSSTEAMLELVEEEREKGIYISVLGFGMDNLKDNMMEVIADNGNGNYAYIDTIEEARKVLVDEFDSTMYTIAKDLKIQVEFNPDQVGQYRLIGYNNRRLENEEFNDDTKDAGDIGAGHSVTAFYELIPPEQVTQDAGSGLAYQNNTTTGSTDYMKVKVRYKLPEEEESRLVEKVVPEAEFTENISDNFAFASSVVEFGLILTDSKYKGESNTSTVIERAEAHKGSDVYGLRDEFVDLAKEYKRMVR